MSDSPNNCPFCSQDVDTVVLENAFAFARYDKFPVSKGHALVIPRRHVADFFDLATEEIEAVHELLLQTKNLITARFHPDGFNVGINIGRSAGQTIMHVHVHLIPRYSGDVENPVGGVRNVIPGMGPYPI